MNYIKFLFSALIIFSLSPLLISQEKEEREYKFPG